MVQYVLKRVTIAGRIAFEPPADDGANVNIKRELKKCRDKYNDYVLVTMQPPKTPRTTGPLCLSLPLRPTRRIGLCSVWCRRLPRPTMPPPPSFPLPGFWRKSRTSSPFPAPGSRSGSRRIWGRRITPPGSIPNIQHSLF